MLLATLWLLALCGVTPEDGLISPSGAYRLHVEHDGKVAIRPRADRNLVARIDLNPGGQTTPSLQVRFTAGDNVLASWGCGTYCSTAPLFTPHGKLLADLGMHDVSPRGDLAVTYDAFDRPMPGAARLVDLRTGVVKEQIHSDTVWNTCSVRWFTTRVVLAPCDASTTSIELRLPR